MNTTEKNILIAYFVFGEKENPTMLNIINHGVEKNGNITYLTQSGLKTQKKNNIEMCKVFNENDVDFKSSLYYWFRKNSGHYEKPIVLNNSLIIGEIYQGSSWRYKLLISPNDKQIEVKIIFD